MQITWFGHSCFRIDTGTASVLIDPFLTGNPTFQDSGVTLRNAIKGVTHVALTHGHEDHTGDVVTVCKDTGAPLLAVHELATYLAGQGVDKIDPGNTGGTLYHGDFDLTFVPAWHSASHVVEGRPVYLGACCGVVIAAREGKTVYHMGDTEIFGDMAITQEVFQPDVGCVPIGDRFTMGAKQAAMACKRFFKFKTIIPVHYGTFPMLDPDASKFVAEMSGHNVVVPEVSVPFDV
jgi:L-ascorbate metabolism protein UlaG (beta-lactamase superfamily)